MDIFGSLPEGSATNDPDLEPPMKSSKKEDKDEAQAAAFPDLYETLPVDDKNKGLGDIRQEPDESAKNEPRSVCDILKGLGQEANDLQSTWSQTFSDCERFEKFCPSRLDHLIKQALQLEQNLLKQKQELSKRLKNISEVLDM